LRQIGGSFGVALLSTLLTTRVIYHSQIYSESLDPNSPVFKGVMANIGYFAVHNAGSTISGAAQQGKILLLSHIGRQAFVQAISDDFLIAAVITLISAIPVFFLRINKKNQKI
ncbi:MAG: drug:proton antiporter, partial [Bacteroidota bacterium]